MLTARALTVVIAIAFAAGACGAGKVTPRPQPFPQPAPFPATAAPEMPRATGVIDSARTQLGVKYQFGGDEPSTGFDCSGLVRYAFGTQHVELPRTVGEQFGRGIKVAIQDLRPGDLVFFSTTGPGPTHVGIVVGNGEFIHAPSSSGVVRIEHYDTPYWHNRLVGARRMF
jgi:cell wall-associated NlpC family hydrolase